VILATAFPFFESRRSGNPNGIPAQSPGLRGTSYPGCTAKESSNPNGVAANADQAFASAKGRNRVAVENISRALTQGSSFLATLGCGRNPFGIEPRRPQ
jgi:hypothetical protein